MWSNLRSRFNRALPSLLRPAQLSSAYLEWKLRDRKVLSGPFQGMRYIRKSVCSLLAPKLFGTYELELRDIIESYCRRSPGLVIDVGAAEGYYAVGFAWRNRRCEVLAFEANEQAHPHLRELAALNGVGERIQVQGYCGVAHLKEALAIKKPDLLIVDIEGGEQTLLDPVAIPQLEGCDVVVELHPWICPGIEELVRFRFMKSHSIQAIFSRLRTPADLPFPPLHRALLRRWLLPQTFEGRPQQMEWFHMKARN